MKKANKGVPFVVNRNLATNLADQVADGFRQAIACGFYKAGDILPTIRELAPWLGVSVRVTADAVKALTAEGLISPRPRCGSLVLGRREMLWKGRVLLVLAEGDYGYNQTAFIGRLRSRLLKAGYLFTQVTVPLVRGRRYDTSVLDVVLGRPVDVALVLYDIPVILKRLVRSGVRFVSVGFNGKRYSGCLGSVKTDYRRAMDALACQCVKCGVRRVVQVCKGSGEVSAVGILRRRGILTRVRKIPLVREGRRLDAIQTATVSMFRQWAERGNVDWPDLFYFTDDYLASAAILALEHLRVRIPDDVKVVSLSNFGHGPVSWGSLTRIEIDPVQDGERVADALLAYLQGGSGLNLNVSIEPSFIVGESFPSV